MHRTTLVVLLAAAVIGIAGGSLLALQRTMPDPTGGTLTGRPITTVSSSSAPGGPSSSDPRPGPTGGGMGGSGALLYADARKIYDGERTVAYDLSIGVPDRLVRTAEGYLLSHPTSTDDGASLRLYAVSAAGRTRKVAEVAGAWDLDPGGSRIVGTDAGSGRLRLWDLTGRVLATTERPVARSAALFPVWTEEAVLLTGRTEEQQAPVWRVWRWDPSAGSPRRTDEGGAMDDWTGSADGSRIAGSVGLDGLPSDESDPCAQVVSSADTSRTDWLTCDWRLSGRDAVFSPDGTRLLVVPAGSDGFGPGEFGTFSASRGPADGVVRFEPPGDWTWDAQWLDDRHLVVRSRTDGNLDAGTGTVLHRCHLRGTCHVVARRDAGELVVGEQY